MAAAKVNPGSRFDFITFVQSVRGVESPQPAYPAREGDGEGEGEGERGGDGDADGEGEGEGEGEGRRGR